MRDKETAQTRMARQLHEESGVPLGPYGHDALEPLVICLLFQDDHYHGCTSYAGFLEWSYFCDQCNRGYDVEEYRHHPCEGRRCPACKQKECGPKHTSPSLSCPSCHRKLYDEARLQWHRTRHICQSLVRCM